MHMFLIACGVLICAGKSLQEQTAVNKNKLSYDLDGLTLGQDSALVDPPQDGETTSKTGKSITGATL